MPCPYESVEQCISAMIVKNPEVYTFYSSLEKEAINCLEISDGTWNRRLKVTEEQYALLLSFFSWSGAGCFQFSWNNDLFLDTYVVVEKSK